MSTRTTNIAGGEMPSPPNTYCNYVQAHWAFDSAAYLADHNLGSSALLVLLCLAKHYNRDEHKSRPGYATIHKETLLSKSTISDALDDLEQVGILHVTRGDSRRANKYWFDFGLVQICTSPNLDQSKSEPQRFESEPLESKSEPLRFESEPEVVKEVVNGKGEEKRLTASQPVGGQVVQHVNSLQDSGKAKTKTPAAPTGPDFTLMKPTPAVRSQSSAASTQSPRPAITTPSGTFPSTPAGQLAQQVWETIGSPRRELQAAQTLWPTRLREHADLDGGAGLLRTLSEVMKTEFYGLGSAEHGPQLPRQYGDSLGYIETNLLKMTDDLDRLEKAAQRKAAASATTTTTTDSAPGKVSYLRSRVVNLD